MTGLGKTLLYAALLFLGGCKLYMSGHSPDYAIIVHGTGELDTNTDTMLFDLVYEGLGFTCAGKSHGRSDGVQGHTGGYTCSDGRTGGGKSQLTHMQGGTGAFTDNCGNSLVYVWGTDQGTINAANDTYRQMRTGKSAVAADKCNTAKAKPAPSQQVERAEPPKPVVSASPLEQRLVQLKRLRGQGLIDDAEYKTEKKEILGRMFAKRSPGEPRVVVPSARPIQPGEIPNVAFGNYHALVIGNDNYTYLPNLKTARNDAQAVAALLTSEYGFKVTTLLDARRADIIENLDTLTESLGPDDNLLIYYAGHGWLEEDSSRGYWLAIDAKPNRRTNWVSNATLVDTLSTLRAKHVMVVADSCFSGTLVRGAKIGVRAGDYWRRMAQKWTRVAMVSGGLEPVQDGNDNHSHFAKAFVSALRSNVSIMDGTQLFEKVRRPVMIAADQTPQYADVRRAGHDGGDFLFVRKK